MITRIEKQELNTEFVLTGCAINGDTLGVLTSVNDNQYNRHGILLSHRGQSVPQIAEIFQVHVNTVRRWFGLWEQGGLETLRHKEGQGRKRLLRSISKERMRELIEGSQRSVSKLRRRLLEEEHIDVSNDTVRRFLKESGL